MITVKLMGGLGNQLFQWAFGQAIRARRGQVNYDISFYESQNFRKFELSRIGLLNSADVTSCSYAKVTEFECSMRFNPQYFEVEDALLVGYWQTEKYFESIADRIRKQFASSIEPTPYEPKMNSVFLHVRRGDYLTPGTRAYHGLLGMDYYARAIDTVHSRVSNPYFFLFSDDPDWVASEFSFLQNYTVIGKGRRAEEEMRLMMMCEHAIIANSSFSWWGAWLGDCGCDEKRTVVAPRNWFAVGPEVADATDIVPDRWIKI